MAPLCCDTPHIVRLQRIKENRNEDVQASASDLYGINDVSVPREESTANEYNEYTIRPANANYIDEDTVSVQNMNGSFRAFPSLPRNEMTNVVTPVQPMPDYGSVSPGSGNTGNMNIPAAPAPGSPTIEAEDGFFPNAPSFQVPSNPLLPPGYNEVMDYNSLQYLNGFYRTQIGKYVRIEQQINSSDIEIRYGYLIGVGINYLLLQDSTTGNVFAIDSYSIKLFYVYYNLNGPLSPTMLG